jgi:glycerol-3-phosphate acyltransferase PlsY
MTIVLLTILAYLLGAIPFGLLVAKMNGVDIRQKGSGNIGATNVLRVIGKGWGIFTFVLDALKGFIPAFFFPMFGGDAVPQVYGVLFGFAAIVGHTLPVYLKFKGGKGVATSAGMLLGVAPVAVGVGLFFFIITVVISRYVSLASILAAIAVGVTAWVEGEKSLFVKIVLTVMSLMIVWLHRANIKRLMNGTENRFGKKKETSA